MPPFAVVIAVLICAASPAVAPVHPSMAGSLSAGFLYPIAGHAHLLAIVAMGLLAASHDGAARLAMPAAFVCGMGLGLKLGASGVPVPIVETMILLSVMMLGGVLASGIELSAALGAGGSGLFANFDDAAHGFEREGATLLPDAAGVLVATAIRLRLGLTFACLLRAVSEYTEL